MSESKCDGRDTPQFSGAWAIDASCRAFVIRRTVEEHRGLSNCTVRITLHDGDNRAKSLGIPLRDGLIACAVCVGPRGERSFRMAYVLLGGPDVAQVEQGPGIPDSQIGPRLQRCLGKCPIPRGQTLRLSAGHYRSHRSGDQVRGRVVVFACQRVTDGLSYQILPLEPGTGSPMEHGYVGDRRVAAP